MLCSHSKKFIYFKTKKTAGTSVEIFFERFCHPEGSFQESHTVNETVSSAGIVGSRRNDGKAGTYYHHMPASEVRDKLGAPIFDSYFKFCVVRNPYDKIVSRFWWELFLADENKWKDFAKLPFAAVKERFGDYVATHSGCLCDDRSIYTIDNTLVTDEVIHFENLSRDIQDVCSALQIPADVSGLGSYKRGSRARTEHYSDYYDSDSRAAIEREFSFELNVFGYRFEPSSS